MSKFKIQTENGTIEVDRSAISLPEGFQLIGEGDIPSGFVKQEVMDSTVADRVSKAKRNALKEAHKDESVRNQVLSEIGVELDEDGKPKGLDSKEIDLDREREKWEKQNLNPVLQENEELKKENSQYQSGLVSEALLSVFAPKMKEGYNNKMFIKNTFAPQFKYSKEHGRVLQVDSEGNFELHPNGKKANGHGYIEPDDFIQINAKSEPLKYALKDDTQGGSDFKTPGSGGDNTITRKQFESLPAGEQAKVATSGTKIVDD